MFFERIVLLIMLFTDQMGRQIELRDFPKRIISLVPSQSELLWDLGLRNELIGITKFCIHPKEMFNNVERVGGTKKINFKKIAALQPDLIIGNKEENEQSQIEELMKQYKVWMSDIYTLTDALQMIDNLGQITNKQKRATELAAAIKVNFSQLSEKITKKNDPVSVAYFIWRKPYLVAGHSTFINEMLKLCGFKNVFEKGFSSRYPEVSVAEISKAKPDVVFLSSEPFPFKEKHIQELKQLLPHSKIMLVDGEMFSWYGSRLLKAPAYFEVLSHKK